MTLENGRESIRHKSHLKHHEKEKREHDARVSYAEHVQVEQIDTGMLTRAQKRAIANIANQAGAGMLKHA